MNIELRGQVFSLLPERALWWPEERTLICSDLHWGRETFLQSYGMPVPERSLSRETLLLEHLIEKTGAEEWWILGDMIHHPQGLQSRLVDRMSDWMLERLRKGLRHIRLVPGNHDRQLVEWAGNFPMTVEKDGLERKGFCFLHEPGETGERGGESDGHFTWYGHLHPAVRLPILGARKVPCFWVRPDQGFLPAFSRMAAGFEIEPHPRRDRVYLVAEGQVLEMPRRLQPPSYTV